MAWKVYAVKVGYKTGLFYSWPDCKKATEGYNGAQFKGFNSDDDALEYLNADKKDEAEIAYDYEVYTDGSFKDGNYSWAYAFIKDGKVVYEKSGKGENKGAISIRNVAGELMGVMQAVKHAHKLKVKIKIFHDYNGVANWLNGTWRAMNPYVQEYKKFMNCYKGIYCFEKVKGHSGCTFNDYVDRKAKEALAS